MDGSSIDNHNRKVYEETVKVIRKAWTDEAWDYDGDLEWFGRFFDQGFMSWEEEVRQIELFAKHIIPAFH
jgi:hypothetical protein